MKIALCSDQHFLAEYGCELIDIKLNAMKEFYCSTEWDYFFMLGDLVDKYECSTSLIVKIMDFIKDNLCKAILIGGNHGHTNKLNEQFYMIDSLKQAANAVVTHPSLILDNIYAAPYFFNGNQSESSKILSTAIDIYALKTRICLGHFSHVGMMDYGKDIKLSKEVQIDLEILKKYKHTFLGHIHKFQQPAKNVTYIGSMFPNNKAEAEFDHYGIIYDTDTGKISKKKIKVMDYTVVDSVNVPLDKKLFQIIDLNVRLTQDKSYAETKGELMKYIESTGCKFFIRHENKTAETFYLTFNTDDGTKRVDIKSDIEIMIEMMNENNVSESDQNLIVKLYKEV